MSTKKIPHDCVRPQRRRILAQLNKPLTCWNSLDFRLFWVVASTASPTNHQHVYYRNYFRILVSPRVIWPPPPQYSALRGRCKYIHKSRGHLNIGKSRIQFPFFFFGWHLYSLDTTGVPPFSVACQCPRHIKYTYICISKNMLNLGVTLMVH